MSVVLYREHETPTQKQFVSGLTLSDPPTQCPPAGGLWVAPPPAPAALPPAFDATSLASVGADPTLFAVYIVKGIREGFRVGSATSA